MCFLYLYNGTLQFMRACSVCRIDALIIKTCPIHVITFTYEYVLRWYLPSCLKIKKIVLLFNDQGNPKCSLCLMLCKTMRFSAPVVNVWRPPRKYILLTFMV